MSNNLSDFNAMKSSARYALSHLDNARSAMKKASKEFSEGVIISGKPYDKGVLKDMIKQLDDIESKITTIYNRCSNKIKEINEANSSK